MWLHSTDFAGCFQYLLVYHNPLKFPHQTVHRDLWEKASEPYTCNEDEIAVKLHHNVPEEEEGKEEEGGVASFVDESGKIIVDKERFLLIGFSANPTDRPAKVLPRTFLRLNQTEEAEEQENEEQEQLSLAETLLDSALGGKLVQFELTPGSSVLLKPMINAPLGYTMWLGSNC